MKALSLFSGIGGIDLAAEWAGIETVAFCEREPFCQKILNKHWPKVPIYDDVCTLTRKRLENDGIDTRAIDLVHLGDPCQPYSVAGEREGEEDYRFLWPEAHRILEEIRPRWVVRENVVGNVTLGLDNLLTDMESLSYTCETLIIPACAVNAQHKRERLFVVAHSSIFGQQKQGEPFHSGNTAQDEKKETTDVIHGGIGRTLAHSNSKSESQTSTAFSSIRSQWNAWSDAVRSGGGIKSGTDWWASEPAMGRVANGIPDRLDRLKSLGNAVVPQQIYPILAAIKQIDDMLQPYPI